MKQVIQNRKSGKVTVADVPAPLVQPGRVLVRTVASVISSGTEKAAVENARKGLVQEARERPDLVRKVIDRARTEGVVSTFNAVLGKLSASQALGYSAAGTVIAVGADVTDFAPGDRVACAGVGFASHAEVLSVPRNLCAKLPLNVSFEQGAFGTLGAIALQGVRLAAPTLGESIVVIGLGLVGQLTGQLLKANGCRVFGVDLDQKRVDLALQVGAEAGAVSDDELKLAILNWTSGRGADAVLITAATDSNQPVELAGEISRMKGRVIVVGMTGLTVPRASYFSRELSLQISMSYGPGRYDPEYEERGNDYPFGYVRWTEQRNLEAFLNLLNDDRVKVEPLITHRFEIDDAERAYEVLSGNSETYLGVVLRYDPEREVKSAVTLTARPRTDAQSVVRLGVVGAGSYLSNVLLPHFKSAAVDFVSVATASGVTAIDAGKKFGFRQAVASATEIFTDGEVNLVLIGTRHDSHAQLAIAALRNNKHVLVEKPLALNDDELNSVIEAAENSRGQLMVGFNRRFSPLTRKAKDFFSNRQAPLSMLYRVNAGNVPRQHWLQDSAQGGGRIVGEICHFIDFMQFLSGAEVESVFAESVAASSQSVINYDSVFITLKFADGSNGCVAYLAEGDQSLAKERVEIFGEAKAFVIDDFRSATGYANGREDKTVLRGQDKGQGDEVKAVCAVVLEGRPAPIPLAEIASTTRATFRVLDSLRTGAKFKL